MLNKSRHTFVLFPHAERCPLELGFNVMINCWERKTTTELHSLDVDQETRENKQPHRYVINRQNDSKKSHIFTCFVPFPSEGTCVLLCIVSPVLPQVLCFSTCPPDVLPHASVSCSLQQLWLITYSDTQSLSGTCVLLNEAREKCTTP